MTEKPWIVQVTANCPQWQAETIWQKLHRLIFLTERKRIYFFDRAARTITTHPDNAVHLCRLLRQAKQQYTVKLMRIK